MQDGRLGGAKADLVEGFGCVAVDPHPRLQVPGKDCAEVDFGPVPVGQRVLRTLEVMNQGGSLVGGLRGWW